MNNLILSTKNTGGQYKQLALINGIGNILIGFVGILGHIFLSTKTSESYIVLFLLLGVFFVVYGVLSMTFKFVFSGSYLEVYEDCVKGKAIQNFKLVDFNIKMSQISNVSTEGIYFIYVHTNNDKYKIVSNKETAQKVFEYFGSK